jgi:DNA polymerase-1
MIKIRFALIDCLALTYSSKYTIPKLYANDEETGILFGFTRYLLALQKKFNFDQFIFCFDSRNSKRKELYPEYKNGRKNFDVSKMVYNQVDILKNEILPKIGFKNLFETDGLEADDIIGSLCQTKNPNDKYIIISRDQDLYQLLNINISQYDYISKKIITLESFQKKYNIDPILWGRVKSIGGCKSDNIAGIPGVGEKTICKYLNNQLKETTKAYQKIESDKGRSLAKFNEQLVNSPFQGTPEYQIILDEISFESLKEIFIKYSFQSQLTEKSLNEWEKQFNWIDVKSQPTLLDFW